VFVNKEGPEVKMEKLHRSPMFHSELKELSKSSNKEGTGNKICRNGEI
jgi:hypothetical protein